MTAAASTRDRVVAAATASFVRRGYRGTTVQAVARGAGVSVQTVYNCVGGKVELFKAAYDVSLVGDTAPRPVARRPAIEAMVAATDPAEVLTAYARMSVDFFHRSGPLLNVLAREAAGNRDLRALFAVLEDERATGTARVAHHLAARFGLRDGLSEQRAAEVLWVLTSVELAERFVGRRSWTLGEFEGWLGRTMVEALLPPRPATADQVAAG